uniref:Uncharacterized protein n=1 Tax=Arundo donax TaxID=35708 RepID=A0A0A9DNU9_ARUDO
MPPVHFSSHQSGPQDYDRTVRKFPAWSVSHLPPTPCLVAVPFADHPGPRHVACALRSLHASPPSTSGDGGGARQPPLWPVSDFCIASRSAARRPESTFRVQNRAYSFWLPHKKSNQIRILTKCTLLQCFHHACFAGSLCTSHFHDDFAGGVAFDALRPRLLRSAQRVLGVDHRLELPLLRHVHQPLHPLLLGHQDQRHQPLLGERHLLQERLGGGGDPGRHVDDRGLIGQHRLEHRPRGARRAVHHRVVPPAGGVL